MVDGKIRLHWMSECIYEQLLHIQESEGTHDISPITLIRSNGRKSDGSGPARLPSPMHHDGNGNVN
jgi:hypothetical protein